MSKRKDLHNDFFYQAWKLQKLDEVRNPINSVEMDVSDIDSYAIGLVGITKPNIPEEFDLLSLSHTGVFKDCIIYAINEPNCVAGSRRIRIIYRNGRNTQNVIYNNSVVQQLVCSVPFVENTELFYKEIFKGKENDTNVQP